MPQSANTGRLFLALWPDDHLRAALVAHQAAWAWPPAARLTPPEDLHLTLHFIGAVPVDRLDEIAAGLALPALRVELALSQAVLWPGGLAMLVSVDVTSSLCTVHADLAHALRRLDLPVEARRYQPHVTLARRAARHVYRGKTTCRSSDQSYVLAMRDGAHYTVLRRYGDP